MAEQTWIQRYREGIVIGLLVCAVWAIMTYLAHINSPWTLPLLKGLAVPAVLFAMYVGVKILQWLPPKRVIPTTKNIEACVRGWLDSYKVSVKSDPSPESYFRLRITLDAGHIMTLVRMKDEYSEYVQILCDLGIRGENKKLIEQFTEEEISETLLELKIELARAKVGYGGLVQPAENFHLFRRVPIHPNLTEFFFMSMVGEVEAATNLVIIILLKAKQKVDKRITLDKQ